MITLHPPSLNKKPRVPAGVRIYAVGDIHGRADLLELLLKRIDADLEENPVSLCIEVYLGDYVDRGPASREVIERLWCVAERFGLFFSKATMRPILPDLRPIHLSSRMEAVRGS